MLRRPPASRLKTFSISFRGRSFDETSYIQQMVAEYGTEHEQLDLNPELDLQGAIEEFAYYSDEPSADAGALPVWFLSKLCKTRTTVALSGEGADELFGGYLTYRANTLRSTPYGDCRRSVLQTGAQCDAPVAGFGRENKLRIQAQAITRRQPDARGARPRLLEWHFFRRRKTLTGARCELPGALDQILGELRGMLRDDEDDLGAYLWFDQKYYLPDDILVKSDRMSMAHAVELRPPFLDHRIVEFAATLAGIAQDSRLAAEVPAEGTDARQAAAVHPAEEENWLRHPGARMAARPAAIACR